MAKGEGSGEAKGAAPSTDNIVAGSAVAICMIVFMCCCGIPMIIAGVAMIYMYGPSSDLGPYSPYGDTSTTPFAIGIVLVVISSILLIIGIVVIVLLCTGKIGKRRENSQGTVMVTQQVPPQGQAYPQGQVYPQGQAYPPGQQGAYPQAQMGAPPPGYYGAPPASSPGYPPQA